MMTNLAVSVAVSIAVAETVADKRSGCTVAGSIARAVAVMRSVGRRRNVVPIGRLTVGDCRWDAVGRLGISVVLDKLKNILD
jgi:hypothetical protein